MSNNNSPHKCMYCHEWSSSPIIRRGSDQDQSSHKMIFRKCPVTKKQINIDSDGCKYFNPASGFYCDNNQCWLTFIECLNRRRNQKGFGVFEKCKKCRQFDKEIKSIVQDYWIDGEQTIKPKRAIKRREKIEKKRVIKRRNKITKRIIKRRSVKRTIKRRK